MIKICAVIIAAIIALSGCAKKAERTESAGLDFKVDTLFTKDGCTVYRFYDAGYHRYFTNCSGSTIGAISTSDGKNHHDEPDGIAGGKP